MDLEQGREAMVTETTSQIDGAEAVEREANQGRWSDLPRAVMGPLETFAVGVSGGVRRNPFYRADD